MKITPVNYNYTNQKVQKNNNQQNFGMIIKPEDIEPILKQVFSKGEDAFTEFCSALMGEAADLGKLRHNGEQITAQVVEGSDNLFKVVAQCGNTPGVSSEGFAGAVNGSKQAGREALERFVGAAKQAANNVNPAKGTIIGNRAREFSQRLKISDQQFNPQPK